MLAIHRLDSASSQSDPSQHLASNDSNQFLAEFNSERGHEPSLEGDSMACYNFPDSPTLGATQKTTTATNQIESLEISTNNPRLPQGSTWSLPLQSSRMGYFHLSQERSEAPTPLVDLLAEDQLVLPGPPDHRFNNTPSVNGKLGDNMLIRSTDLVGSNPESVSKNGSCVATDADSGFCSMNVDDCNSFPGQTLGNHECGGNMSYYSSNLDIDGSVGTNSHIPNVTDDQHSDSNISDATNCIAPDTPRELGFPKVLSTLHKIHCDKDHRNVAMGLGGACDCGITKVHAICIWATNLPHYEVVRSLSAISNKDELDGAGNTPLHYLAAAGKKRLLDYILSFGVDVKRLNTFGQNFLHVLDASSFSDELIDFLGSFKGYGLLDQRDHDGRTVLHGLLRYSIDQSVCRELVAFYGPSGAFQFALRDSQGRNAAHYLDLAQQRYSYASYEYTDCIQTTLLFKNTARSFVVRAEVPNDTTKRRHPDKDEGWAAVLNRASSVPDSENWSGSNALHCLAFWPAGRSPDVGEFRVNHVKQYISCGVDLNSYDQAGRTPLLAHLHESHPEDDESAIRSIVKLLVDNGANIHLRDRDGHTAIYHAVVKGFSGCVSFLLQNGARANSRVKNGRSLRAIAQEALQLQLVADDQAGSDRLKKHLTIMQDLITFSAVLEPTQLQEWGVKSTVTEPEPMIFTP